MLYHTDSSTALGMRESFSRKNSLEICHNSSQTGTNGWETMQVKKLYALLLISFLLISCQKIKPSPMKINWQPPKN
jgi:hypothetical protein